MAAAAGPPPRRLFAHGRRRTRRFVGGRRTAEVRKDALQDRQHAPLLLAAAAPLQARSQDRSWPPAATLSQRSSAHRAAGKGSTELAPPAAAQPASAQFEVPGTGSPPAGRWLLSRRADIRGARRPDRSRRHIERTRRNGRRRVGRGFGGPRLCGGPLTVATARRHVSWRRAVGVDIGQRRPEPGLRPIPYPPPRAV